MEKMQAGSVAEPVRLADGAGVSGPTTLILPVPGPLALGGPRRPPFVHRTLV
jgi:hypothetical protein